MLVCIKTGGFILHISINRPFDTMSPKKEITIQPPLDGEWKFLRPPGHHPFAFDFVQADANRKKYSPTSKLRLVFSGIPSTQYYCWGRPVYAPVDGIVVRVGDGWEDHKSTNVWQAIWLWYNATYRFRPKMVNNRLDIRPNAGNYLMIKTDDGYVVFLAHLRNGSITVSEGQSVSRGELVGKVGNSGNSTAPHLHINVFDQIEDPYKSKVLPFVFRHYEMLDDDHQWERRNFSVPIVGSFVKFNLSDSSTGESNDGPQSN